MTPRHLCEYVRLFSLNPYFLFDVLVIPLPVGGSQMTECQMSHFVPSPRGAEGAAAARSTAGTGY